MAHDVFISHSSEDKVIADAACAVLEQNGHRCWIAPRDILPGQAWPVAIVRAINQAQVMVLVFSGHANVSPQVEREVERAVNRGIPLIPMRIEDIALGESLEFFISSRHWLDAFTPPLEQHLTYLSRVVEQILSKPGAERRETGRRFFVASGQSDGETAMPGALPPDVPGSPLAVQDRSRTGDLDALLGGQPTGVETAVPWEVPVAVTPPEGGTVTVAERTHEAEVPPQSLLATEQAGETASLEGDVINAPDEPALSETADPDTDPDERLVFDASEQDDAGSRDTTGGTEQIDLADDPQGQSDISADAAIAEQANLDDSINEETPPSPPTEIEERIISLRREAATGADFYSALYRNGITLTYVDTNGKDKLAYDLHRKYHELRISGVPVEEPATSDMRVGELVAVTVDASVHRLRSCWLNLDDIEAVLKENGRNIPSMGSVRAYLLQGKDRKPGDSPERPESPDTGNPSTPDPADEREQVATPARPVGDASKDPKPAGRGGLDVTGGSLRIVGALICVIVALFLLGSFITYQDELAAFQHTKSLADGGNTDAQMDVAEHYESGHLVNKDNNEALAWYRKAAAKGAADAQINVGRLLYDGEGVTKNDNEALLWMSKAAQSKNGASGTLAMWWLGYMYATGINDRQDLVTARQWMSRAADRGDADAKKWLVDNPPKR